MCVGGVPLVTTLLGQLPPFESVSWCLAVFLLFQGLVALRVVRRVCVCVCVCVCFLELHSGGRAGQLIEKQVGIAAPDVAGRERGDP